jgi:hypothetical protein
MSGIEKMAKLIGENIKKLMPRKEGTPFILKWEENQKDPTQKETNEKLTNDINREPSLKENGSSKRQNQYPATRNDDFYGQ